MKSEYEALDNEFSALKYEKVAMEEQIRSLKRGSDQKDKHNGVEVSVDLDDDIGVLSESSGDDIPISSQEKATSRKKT